MDTKKVHVVWHAARVAGVALFVAGLLLLFLLSLAFPTWPYWRELLIFLSLPLMAVFFAIAANRDLILREKTPAQKREVFRHVAKAMLVVSYLACFLLLLLPWAVPNRRYWAALSLALAVVLTMALAIFPDSKLPPREKHWARRLASAGSVLVYAGILLHSFGLDVVLLPAFPKWSNWLSLFGAAVTLLALAVEHQLTPPQERQAQRRKAIGDWKRLLNSLRSGPRGRKREEIAAIVANWRRDELTVDIEWSLWWLSLLFVGVGCGCLSLICYSRAPAWSFALLVLIVLWAVVQIALARRVRSAGYAFRLGPDGICDSLGTRVAWRDVLGADVKVSPNVLVLAVNSAAAIQTLDATHANRSWRLWRLWRLWGGPFIRVVTRKAWLEIPCDFIGRSSPVLCAAARYLAQRGNPAFDPDWKCH